MPHKRRSVWHNKLEKPDRTDVGKEHDEHCQQGTRQFAACRRGFVRGRRRLGHSRRRRSASDRSILRARMAMTQRRGGRCTCNTFGTWRSVGFRCGGHRGPSYRCPRDLAPRSSLLNGRILSAPHRWHRRASCAAVDLLPILRFFDLQRFCVGRQSLRFAVQSAGMFTALPPDTSFFAAHAARSSLGNPSHGSFVGCFWRASSRAAHACTEPRCEQRGHEQTHQIT